MCSMICIDYEGAGALGSHVGILCMVLALCWVKPLYVKPFSNPGFLPHLSFSPSPPV